MENNNPMELGNGNNSKIIVSLLAFTFFLLVFFYFFFYTNYFDDLVFWRGEREELKNTMATQTMVYVKNSEATRLAHEYYKNGQYQESFQEFSNILNNSNLEQDKDLYESLLLYKFASQLQVDREAALSEYYNFYKDENKSNRNRAYALLMAQQNVMANNDAKKLLFVLDEADVRDLKTLDNKNINYLISKRIYQLYPFAITSARLCSYEIENLDKNSTSTKKQAEEVYNKYMYNFDQVLQIMLAEEGFRHLVANSLSAKAGVLGRLEDFKIKDPTETTQVYSDAINYAKLYSPRSTYDFLLAVFLNHEVKTNNQTNINKIIDLFKEDKTTGYITPNVLKNFSDEVRMQETYPEIYFRYKNDDKFRGQIQGLTEK